MKRKRGSSLIEFALGLVVLAPVAVELTSWAATAYVIHELQSAVSQGAVFGSVEPLSWQAPDRAFENRVRNVVLYGHPDGQGKVRIPGLAASNVHVRVDRVTGSPRSIEVSIEGYQAPGGIVKLEVGPRVAMPYRGKVSGYAP
jgi:hypothetical protein